jgi:hypothetical protein
MKIKLKILTASVLLVMTAACSATQGEKSVSNNPIPTSTTGDSTVIAVKINGEKGKDSTNISSSRNSIGKKTGLTAEHIQSLTSAENNQSIPQGKSNIKLEKKKTILPTYIPPGFKVKKFEINPCAKLQGWSGGYTYKITYRKSSNTFFQISNYLTCGDGGADPGDVKTIEIPSKKFDKVIINYTEFDQFRNSPYANGQISSPSPDTPGADRILMFLDYYSNPLNLAEAKKIMESMEYLNATK